MAVSETYVPRLKQRYNDELRAPLQGAARCRVDHAGAAITKITLNMGVGEAKTDAKMLDGAMEELSLIAGQRAQVRRARKSVAQFKIREGMPIGARVTLRGDRMWEFLDRLISIALPAHPRLPRAHPDLVRRPRELLARVFASRSSFPEIDYDAIKEIRGLDVAITTTAETDEQAEALLRGARNAARGRGGEGVAWPRNH